MRATLTLIVTSTSGCSETGTLCNPIVLIGAFSAGFSFSGEVVLPANFLERDAPVTIYYRTNARATGKGSLLINWTDAHGRAVEERRIPFELSDETDVAFTLVQAGLLRGKSIGFLPLQARRPTEAEIANQPALGQVRFIIEKWLLLEYACVFLPAQQNAVVEAVSKGVKIPDDILELLPSGTAFCTESSRRDVT